MKILVTGHKGFIGNNLINQLSPEFTFGYANNNREEQINVLDRKLLDSIGNIDAIVHLASKTSIINSYKDPYNTYYTNIVGTLNILDFAKERRIDKIIYVSTYIYGNPIYLPIDENHPIAPHAPYNKSKYASETLCKYYSDDYGLNIVTLRPFYVYGFSPKGESFIPAIIKQINKNGKVILSKENTKRDFLFITDYINLIRSILLKFPQGYNVYNVGSGKSYSLENIVEIIEKILEKQISIEYNLLLRPNDVTEMYADIKKLNSIYGWKPKVDIEEGLRLILKDRVL